MISAEKIHAEKYFDPIHPIMPNQKVYLVWYGDNDEINCNILLDIPHTGIDVYGVLLGHAEKAVQVNVNILHKAKDTRSNVILKGLLNDKSRVRFKGLTKIEKGAKQSNAWLSCYYLMLSKEARGQAIPSLEILENDVKAGHATTSGRMNEKELFYLQARGLSKEKAKALLIKGFIDDVLRYMPDELKRRIRSKMITYGY